MELIISFLRKDASSFSLRNDKNHNAVVLGRRGGKIGGIARAKKLSKERKREIAIMGAAARWKKTNPVESEPEPNTDK